MLMSKGFPILTFLYFQDYADVLDRQLGESEGEADIGLGRSFTPAELEMMNDQQLGQLLELKTETTKSRE